MARPVVWLRIGATVGGGFGVSSLAVLALSGLLARCGMPSSEAVVAGAMSGFLIYLAILLWGLACVRTWALCAWLVLWTALLAGLAQWVVP